MTPHLGAGAGQAMEVSDFFIAPSDFFLTSLQGAYVLGRLLVDDLVNAEERPRCSAHL